MPELCLDDLEEAEEAREEKGCQLRKKVAEWMLEVRWSGNP